MAKLTALSFESYQDFEICNEVMKVRPGDTATSSDGMFTVVVKTDGVSLPSCTLIVTSKDGRRVFVRVISGTEATIEPT